MTTSSKFSTESWLEYVQQSFQPGMMLQSENAQIASPANAIGVGDYDKKAAQAAGSGKAPVSVFEGLQTIANLSRVRAEYNPLDPKGTGNMAHFLAFTQNIADAPMLSLQNASTASVKIKSQNSDKLIDAFADTFIGISSEDQSQIVKAVTNLVKAALSYVGKTETLSNFVQNLLQTNSSGDVELHLYSSQFSVVVSDNKGTIDYKSSYEVLRAVYQLSQGSWNEVKEQFSQIEKTTTKSWINQMTTKTKETVAGESAVRAECLYN